jgi:3-oxosteroid 1-dehydrogenase
MTNEIPDKWDLEIDVAVVGSSSGGLVGAIVGHDLGLSTLVLEKASTVGGGNALSGGLIWIPDNHHMEEAGFADSRDDALVYIRHIAMGRHDEQKVLSFVDNGPQMVRYIESHTRMKFIIAPDCPDYCAELPGGKIAGRCLLPDPIYTAIMLAESEPHIPLIKQVRRPPVTAIFGIPDEIFVAGRSLIGPLIMACHDRGINILTNTRAKKLIVNKGKVIGLLAITEGREIFIKSKKAVLLATGGYEWNMDMNKRFLHGFHIYATTNPQNEGDGHIMGMEVGAAISLMDHTMWVPVIHVNGEEIDGKPFYRFFLMQCRNPGAIVVNRSGKRCYNESFGLDAGHPFTARDLVKSEYTDMPMFWIGDQSNREKYYCGPLAPGASADGAEWIHSAASIRELADKLGLPAGNLEETIQRFNRFAADGIDPDFHRGETAYDRSTGDPNNKPNPCLGPLLKPPFYGVQIYPGTAGHQGGLVTNENAQVISAMGDIIPGLYATSNTAAHTDIGFGYQSGFANGRSMVWGYVAAQNITKNINSFGN